MDKYSAIATLDNLNTVYQDIRGRIDTLGDMYKIKGSITTDKLLELPSADAGDVYNISNDDDELKISSGDNVACLASFKKMISPGEFSKYWFKVGGVYEKATDDVAGVICTGTTIATDNSTSGVKSITENSNSVKVVQRGLKLKNVSGENKYLNHNQAYVDIPIASTNTYGVITNQAQTLAGLKTFNSGIKTFNSGIETFNSGITISDESNPNTEAGITVKHKNTNDTTVSTTIKSNSLTIGATTGSDGKSTVYTGSLNVNSGTVTLIASEVDTDFLKATNEINVGSVSASSATLEVGRNGSITVNDKLTITGENSEVNTLEVNTIKLSNGNNVDTLTVSSTIKATNLEANTINAGEVKGVSSAENSSPKTNIFAKEITATKITCEAIEEDPSGDPSLGTITANSIYAEKLGVSDDRVTTINADSVTATTVKDVTTLSTTEITATNLKVITGDSPTLNADSVTATTVHGIGEDTAVTTINADTVTVANLTGTGTDSTLNAQTINAKGTDGSVTMKYIPAGTTIVAGSSTNTKAPHKGFLVGNIEDKDTGLYVSGHLYAFKVHNAVWNDLADAIEIDCKPEHGYVYCFDGEHYSKSSKYCQKGVIGIHSDTAGMIMGEKGGENELNCAVAGFVLAHVDKVYPSGTPLTASKNGTLTKMKKKDLILHPDRLVANFWKPEVGDKWNGVEVNNRCWVKVR